MPNLIAYVAVWLLLVLISQAVIRTLEPALFRHMRLKKEYPDPKTKRFPPWLMGAGEQTIFFLLALSFDDKVQPLAILAVPAIAWIALKMALNWQRRDSKKKKRIRIIRRSHVALALSVTSLTLAIAAGANAKWLVSLVQ